jgi:hypothetical protein
MVRADHDHAAHIFFPGGLIHVIGHLHIAKLIAEGAIDIVAVGRPHETKMANRIRSPEEFAVGAAILIEQIDLLDAVDGFASVVAAADIQREQVVAFAQVVQNQARHAPCRPGDNDFPFRHPAILPHLLARVIQSDYNAYRG